MESLEDNVKRRKRVDAAFAVLGALLITLALGVLLVLVADLVRDGAGRLHPDFLTSFPSRHAAKAGIKSALVGTCLVMMVTSLLAIPLGIATGVYLEEYAKKNRLTAVIEINIANLAGVPSIIWGLMALGVLIYQWERWLGDPNDGIAGLGRSVLTAGCTLGLLVLPIVIVATRESIRAIPQSIREASYACGATKLQTVWSHILPYSMSGVLTGSILALSRAIGETAPLITIGALTYIAFLPPVPFSIDARNAADAISAMRIGAGGEAVGPAESAWIQATAWLNSGFTVLPIQMFNWVSRPDKKFQENAAATGVVLLAITLAMNALAITLRYRLRKRIRW
ncbi:MAG: phosphate ABC transporter permease PstA [Phycisphaerales bacterium]